MLWRAGSFEFVFPRPALVMGIVNVTPDSFSDGGRFLAPDAAVAHGLRLVDEGADLLDIGGESTRPNAAPVTEAEELRRVIPVIEQLVRQVQVPISIDTMKPAVARAAVAAGASLINDVAANRPEAQMGRLAAQTGTGYVVVHMQGTPQTMQAHPVYQDVVAEVNEFFGRQLARLGECGVRPEQVVLDVGIGFGKTVEHNLQLLAALGHFTKWERPLLLGVSRKSFIGKLLGADLAERLPAGLACAGWALEHGVQMIRTHDVAATVQAARMLEAIRARATT
jgi:dihydropteroate synthase